MRRSPCSRAALIYEILDDKAAERDAAAPRPDAGNDLASSLGVDHSIEPNEAGDGFAATGDDNFLTGLDPIEQLAEFAFGLEGANFSHDFLTV
jgi:hypothetical protein